jgi:hypothetical protein
MKILMKGEKRIVFPSFVSCANANQQKKGEMEKKNKTASFRYEARVWFNF